MQSEIESDALFEIAVAHHQAGDFQQAEQAYRQLLQTVPDDPDALNFLGVLLQDIGDFRQSLQVLQQAVDQTPDFAEALTNLARVQQILGQPEAAIESSSKAIEIDPELAPAHLHLGRALLDLWKFDLAEASLNAAIRLAPEEIDPHIYLGSVFLGQGDIQKARQSFETARRLQPGRLETALKIGGAWLGANRHHDAIEAYHRATAEHPHCGAAYAGLAFAYWSTHSPQQTIDACRQALALVPERTDVWLLLAQALARFGRFAEARATLEKMLEIEPDSVRARRDLALIQGAEDADLEVLSAVVANESAPELDRIAAAFGLGNAFDQLGDYDRAFSMFGLANHLTYRDRLQTGRGYVASAAEASVDWFVRTFQPEIFPLLAQIGNPADDLVFIVGMPRSGTSLVEQIAASHPDVFGAGETKRIGELVTHLEDGTRKLPVDWPVPTAQSLVGECIAGYRQAAGSAKRITDKLPDNIFLLGHIALFFPNARVIVCRRDPRDTCLSAFFQNFGSEMAWSHDLSDCADHAQTQARLMAHWRKVLPIRIHEIQYETLVSDFENECRRLINFLDLEWDPACLTFFQTERAVMTASFWQVRQPLYHKSVGRWQNYRTHLTMLRLGLIGLLPDPDAAEWDELVVDTERAIAVAMNHHRLARFGAAKQIYQAILRRNPDHAKALHLSAIECLNSGNYDEALPLLHRAAEVGSLDVNLQSDIARAQNLKNDYAAAAASARAALALDDKYADAWCQLSYALMGLADEAGALAAIEQAGTIDPDGRQYLTGKATIFLQMKRHSEAEAIWRRADTLFPNDLDILSGLAQTLSEQGIYDQGIQTCKLAVSLSPANARLLHQMASLELRGHRVDEAIKTLEHLLALHPTMVDGWLLLGFSRAMSGHHEDAARDFRQALKLSPNNASALAGLMQIARSDVSADVLSASANLASDSNLPARDQVAAAFAIANEYERRGQYDAAFAAFQTANGRLRQLRRPQELKAASIAHRQMVDTACILDKNILTYLSPFGLPSQTPVFIVGLPRSGTSLIEQIAASHPQVHGLGEQGDFLALLGPEANAMLCRPIDQWDMRAMRGAAEGFLADLTAKGKNAARIINKLPMNMYRVGIITALFPQARIIVCRRDLRDVSWSCYSQYFFDDGLAWSDTLEDCADYIREAERLMDHWQRVLPDRFLEVFYEDVVDDIEGQARRLIDYLGLEWDPACLSFYNTERVVMTASHWQVRQPIYATSVGKWRHYREHLTPLLEGLKGYIPEDD